MNNETLNRMVSGYLDCAAWADAPEGSNARFTQAAKDKARTDCAAFIEACGPLVDQALEQPGYTPERFGHDFWLTRCGHGTGFYDRDELQADTRANVTFEDREGRTQAVNPGDPLGESLTAIAYGETAYISRFAYASLSAYRGWLYFD